MNRSVESQAYTRLGVSAEKADVEKAAASIDSGLYPSAFCRVLPDLYGGDPTKCVLSHSDGAGTKAILAYLLYRSTGDASGFRQIAHDALVMNLDDMLCAGAVSNFTFVSIINRNSKRIGADVLDAVIEGTLDSIRTLSEFGIDIAFCGGETADVGDIVRSVLVDGALATRMNRADVVRNEISPGHVLVTLSSGGAAAAWEKEENSGIAANGLTLARHALLDARKLSSLEEVSDDARAASDSYFGSYGLSDKIPGSSLTVAQALLSPTRTFAPVIRDILSADRKAISGIFHLTGGGHFKSLKVARGVRIAKRLPKDVPPLFHAIRAATGLSWLDLARVFNLGWRMEVYCDRLFASEVVSVSRRYGVAAEVTGEVEALSTGARELEVTIFGETEQVSG